MRAALAVAEAEDGCLWLYDEDLWPSGNAGGQVAATCEEYRQACLQAESVGGGDAPRADVAGELRAAYAIRGRRGGVLLDVEPIKPERAAEHQGVERLVLRRHYAPRTGWWSGESYANLLHPGVTRRFIELTHEICRKHFGEHCGKRIPGIFTDEPQLYSRLTAVPWYDGIPAVYAERTGRDFWADLPFPVFGGAELVRVKG